MCDVEHHELANGPLSHKKGFVAQTQSEIPGKPQMHLQSTRKQKADLVLESVQHLH